MFQGVPNLKASQHLTAIFAQPPTNTSVISSSPKKGSPSGDLAVSNRMLGTCSAGRSFEDVAAKAWVNPGGPSWRSTGPYLT